jgi:hypothetical protein
MGMLGFGTRDVNDDTDAYGNPNPYDGNPWAVLDNPTAWAGNNTFDCWTLVQIAFVQMAEVGFDVTLGLAYPNSAGDATTQQQSPDTTQDLAFYSYDGVHMNLFEANLQLNDAGDAYLFFPVGGPLYPWAGSSVPGMPATTVAELQFEVIYTELLTERSNPAVATNGGQQWWVYAPGTSIGGVNVGGSAVPGTAGGPFAFPVSIP